MSVKNGKPATSFNAQNRKWVRGVAKEEAEKASIAVEALSVTENNTYIAPAGKAYSPVVVNVPNPSTGKVNITSTAEVDVTDYATAQVVDANLVAGNIKKDTTILGVTGSYEGGGGSSDFSTATVVIDNQNNISAVTVNVPCVFEENAMGDGSPACVYYSAYCEAGATFTATVPLYKGGCVAYSTDITSCTGDITAINTGMYMITGNGTLVTRSPF